MKSLNILGVLFAFAITGCAGRTAAWEADETTTKAVEGEGAAEAAAAAVAEGDELWNGRDNADNIRKAIAVWEKVVAGNAGDYETVAKITHAYYFLADGYLRDNDDEYLDTMDKGVAWGEKGLLAVSPEFKTRMKNGDKLEKAIEAIGKEGVPTLYWYATNLGKWAKKKGFAVLLGNKDKVKAVMERCLALDSGYFYSAPDRYFGAFYAIAPSFAGGDLDKSEAHYKASLEKQPNYLGTHVLMAENLAVKRQNKDLFMEQLKFVIDADEAVIPELVPEARVEKQKAKELLEKIDDLF